MRFRFGIIASLLLVSIAPAAHATIDEKETLPQVERVDYYEWEQAYHGGPNTLPYGQGDASRVLDHARGMSSVQSAVSAMLERGYLRRDDTDAAFTTNGYSMAVLGFEKPGFDVETEEQPALIVITQAYEVPRVGWRPTSQVFGGLVRDSAGVVLCTSTPADSAMFVFGTRTESLLTPSWTDEQLEYQYTAFDALRGARRQADFYNFSSHVSAALQPMWATLGSPLGQAVTVGACAGAASAMAGSGGLPWAAIYMRMGLGAMIGGYGAYANYWAAHPDTTRR